ncbi:unnamed protein product [Trichogramma brassicae]|uniref:Uncharacterized protein n=1 Tax=Trichogramma brassicae TaxID=86971 RepID=A0A6H5HW96_9HYME|nr:unnamed protein product [Trichogramma brassicae]
MFIWLDNRARLGQSLKIARAHALPRTYSTRAHHEGSAAAGLERSRGEGTQREQNNNIIYTRVERRGSLGSSSSALPHRCRRGKAEVFSDRDETRCIFQQSTGELALADLFYQPSPRAPKRLDRRRTRVYELHALYVHATVVVRRGSRATSRKLHGCVVKVYHKLIWRRMTRARSSRARCYVLPH